MDNFKSLSTISIPFNLNIIGKGVEGKANYQYFKNTYRDVEIFCYDEKDGDNLSEIPLVSDGKVNILVRSPGIAPYKFQKGSILWSGTNEFFSLCQAKIIGVTGTKGKGTTASLIYSALKKAYQKSDVNVYLVGNIGLSSLSILPQIKSTDIVVYELSSFQLWDLKFSPDIAVYTILEPDHLDVHTSLEEYYLAKQNLIKFQTANNCVVYNSDDVLVNNIASNCISKKIPYPDADSISEAKKTLKLIGEHNLVNASGAVKVLQYLGIHKIDFGEFSGLNHRLKYVKTVNNISYYDDSIATTPSSAIVAAKSFLSPKIMILGGKDKGADYRLLASSLLEQNIKFFYFYGNNRHKIFKCFENIYKQKGISSQLDDMFKIVDNPDGQSSLNQIVKDIDYRFGKNPQKYIAILSPAAASFDMFKSYIERGNCFIDAISNLEK